ncbi:DUF5686 and carboxypeptidase regulatory-like domain-containing protein [Salinimicrobium sp. TH3]|uniref:DUF5686 and carboxypeptidase regulatory-like domain-containing protein n=1 Tax=Salinimicrobium sp. TH3 TaxID=2997342 RepID=UPI0022733BD8|nr:DUF5686 and carboxypeptidase regulatory-like domain-containing protein [Salinimicrobium sp. TH3]MCY2687713.1 DUF5686 and carboxypeptidase regulatory-like domain-containing protein [Salinimicrobium sp. TH3]
MNKLYFPLLLFLCCFTGYAQITGKVTNQEGTPLAYVNIYLDGTFSGTTSNENGIYNLELSETGNYTVVFQFLGYKTEKKTISVTALPYTLNAKLTEESTTLDEVIVNSGDNPANKIMRNAIEKRDFHRSKIREYTADFYSRGLWRIKNAPEKILGQEVGDLGGGLDSTRSGVVYLSETISEITYKAPNDFKEKIIASKVSGNDNGFSLNSAQEANISFYDNTISLNTKLISPLANYAFNYYNFKLEGVFYNDRGDLVNKIQVTPKRPKDKVFSGFIYIIEDSWQLYGVELKTTGEAIQVPPIEELVFRQNFNFSKKEQLWVPISQTIDFAFNMFGIKGDGRFTAAYTNYDFSPSLEKKTFTNEIVSFAPEANKKDSIFWSSVRPVPLTEEEQNDYIRKDSLQELRESKPYLDSLDNVRNKFGLGNLITGYTYSNSYEKWSLNIGSPIFNTNINTVQGYNSTLEASFRKNTGESFGQYWRIFSEASYGFSEEKFRISGGFQQKFNNISNPVLTVSGGSEVAQINSREPISKTLNSITTSFFERNYMKLYELDFAKVSYQQELFNGFSAFSAISYENRSPLYNHRDKAFLIDWDEREFTSNNPLQPNNENSAPFVEHEIFKISLAAKIEFAQKYLSYPNAKFNIKNEDYPSLTIRYDKGLGANIREYNFDHLRMNLLQEFTVANKGELGYSITGGTFFGNEELSFLDYWHFDGNQTRIGTSSNYLGKFNLLPYYALSTNKNYVEGHVEHNFQGYILGRVPLINRLNYNLVVGAHALSTEGTAPYFEYSIGLDNLGYGKFRFLRLDYVVSQHNGNHKGAFIFGLKFLEIF